MTKAVDWDVKHQFKQINKRSTVCNTGFKKYFYHLRPVMRKPDFCPCENEGADQLCCNCTAEQHLCFRYADSTMPHLLISEISSFFPLSVTVQADLCWRWLETQRPVFSCCGSFAPGYHLNQYVLQYITCWLWSTFLSNFQLTLNFCNSALKIVRSRHITCRKLIQIFIPS